MSHYSTMNMSSRTGPPLARWLVTLVLIPFFVLVGCDDNGGGGTSEEAPTAEFTTSVDEFTVEFDASGSSDPDGGEIQSYDWEFGDGTSGSGATTTHTYDEIDDFNVTLEVVDDENTIGTTQQTVSINPNQIVVTDDITSNTTWTANRTYVLDGLIFVNPDVTLTIEPGTVIKGRPPEDISNNDGASALIVRRRGQLIADGEADNPIIFTSTLDDLSDPSDLGPTDRGLWGGVILLGRAPISEPSSVQIEGIPDTENALFGGTVPDDNSGTLRYLSIRHGGFSISGVSGDEINALTMGGVGSGTTIEYIESFANLDDGFEWFGGTVHTRYLVSAFNADDSFDWDTGFRGTGQFWFAVQAADAAGRAGELDGFDLTTNDNADEFSDPVITNATWIGSGSASTATTDAAFRMRNGGAGEFYNSIFTSFPDQGIRIDADDSANQRFEEGDITIRNNVFFDFGAGSDIPSIVVDGNGETNGNGNTRDEQFDADNTFADPALGGIDRGRNGTLDPRPTASSLPTPEGKSSFENTSANGSDDFPGVDLAPIQDVNYIGAFEPGAPLWTTGWTKLSTEDYAVE